MKRVFKLISICLVMICFLLIPNNVKAAIDSRNGLVCDSEITLDNGITAKTCTISFEVVNQATTDNQAKLVLTLTNLTIHSLELEDDWKQTTQDGTTLTFETTKSKLDIGKHTIGKITFYKVRAAENCYVRFHIETSRIERNCLKEGNLYYDETGELTTEFEFKRQCEPHQCEVLTDTEHENKKYYFDNEGNEVEEEEYNTDCSDKHYCEKSGEDYYDSKGEKTTKEKYEKECVPHYCEKFTVENETICESSAANCYDDGKTMYFDKKGKETSKENYDKECFTHECEILDDDTYYGKKGNIVDALTYKKECEKNTCTVLDDGTHFDKSGNITDLNTYRQQCEKITCEKVGNKYYDKDGKEVSQSEYNISCEKVAENPKTGMAMPIVFLILVTITGIFGLVYTKKHNKFM